MTIEKLFKEIPDAVKLDFLQKALRKNDALCSQFTRYCSDLKKGKRQTEAKIPEQIISDACKQLKTELESLDFNNMDWQDYVPRHSGYIEDYEAYEYFADDHLTGLFEGWQHQICQQLQQGELTHGLCQVMGCYSACFDVEIPGAGDIFEDLTDELLAHHQELQNAVVDTLKRVTGSEAEIQAMITAILDHTVILGEEHVNFLNYLETVFLLITETAETARYISGQLESRSLAESIVPQLALRIASFDPDPLIWLEKAEEYMELDLEVAKQLLDHYWLEDPECFRLVGKKMFGEHPRELCDFFSEKLFPMFDETFYKEVLWFRTLRDQDIDLYNELRNYLTEQEKQRFLDEITWDTVFRINVLASEKRFPDILVLAQKEVLHTWHFTELITPILNIYPAEVMELIRIKCADTLTNHKKRSGYQRMVKWLQLALQITGMEDQVRHLIHEFYNRRPALPALKEEMREAGVVNDKKPSRF